MSPTTITSSALAATTTAAVIQPDSWEALGWSVLSAALAAFMGWLSDRMKRRS